eukprot:1161625-Pelagomonas_calceolata.AAC.13
MHHFTHHRPARGCWWSVGGWAGAAGAAQSRRCGSSQGALPWHRRRSAAGGPALPGTPPAAMRCSWQDFKTSVHDQAFMIGRSAAGGPTPPSTPPAAAERAVLGSSLHEIKGIFIPPLLSGT